MKTKDLIAGVAGGLTLFVCGFLIYVLLLPDLFQASLQRDPMNLPLIGLGEVVWGCLLAWVMGRFGITSVVEGAKAGAIFGFLAATATGLVMYGASTIADAAYYVSEAVAFAVRYGAAGAVIGWMFSRDAASSD